MSLSEAVQKKLDMSLDDLSSSGKKKNNHNQKKNNNNHHHNSNTSKGSVFERLGQRKGEEWRKHVQVLQDADGSTVTKFHNTEIVRITPRDIILDCGMRTQPMATAINDALKAYMWKVFEKGGEWYASDSTVRLIRFSEDRLVLPGAATELAVGSRETGTVAAAASAPGPVRVATSSVGRGAGMRFRPY